ncbi:hypothetical protein Trydic_g16754 [Trypoxylus dichotomus]
MQKLLDDSTCKPITTDPTTYLKKTTRTKINNAPLSEETKKSIIQREISLVSKNVRLLKIHKEDIPLRSVNSPRILTVLDRTLLTFQHTGRSFSEF